MRPRNPINIIIDSAGRLFNIVVNTIVDPRNYKLFGYAPEVLTFQASHSYVDDLAEPVILKWEVKYADKVLLNGEDVTHLNEKRIHLQNDQTFRLEAISEKFFDEQGSPLKDVKSLVVHANQEPPEILFFHSNKSFVTGGEEALLTWETHRAATVILEGYGQVSGGSKSIIPTHDKVFRIRAIGYNNKEASASLTINVDKSPPTISFFRASEYFLRRPTSVSLSWEVENAKRVEITSIGEVPRTGETSVSPRSDSVFVLIATSFYGVTSQERLEIEVSKDPPNIEYFISDKMVWIDENPAIIKWKVQDAEKVFLEPSGRFLPSSGEMEVLEKEDTEFVLRAISYFGEESVANLRIRINRNPPDILKFSSDKEFIIADNECTLSWKVDGGYEVKILPDLGKVPSEGSERIVISKDTQLTLKATSYFGYSISEKLEIKVLPIPLIKSVLVPQPMISSNFNLNITPIKGELLMPRAIPQMNILLQNQILTTDLDKEFLSSEIIIDKSELPPLNQRKARISISANSIKEMLKRFIRKINGNEKD